ncbi:uncharacterized protein L201_004860 [Kwoniella dendrophila CBS 6074]|uniref:Impact N-terminal domain-containing protein n=1 Tax=Kwoniella dendrophila CBS 6074 TaxID=1295534 RepID=A0AAX4JXE5_9TREE
MTSTKRPSSPNSSTSDQGESSTTTKKARLTTPLSGSNEMNKDKAKDKPISLHSWLHPSEPELILTHSPALHSSTSTFLGFAISFLPPTYITSLPSLEKECRRIIRELNVINLVGDLVSKDGEGAFQNGQGKSPNNPNRIREPDHRIWACRTLTLKDGKDGTGGEDDYQLLEASFDDNEKYGSQSILKTLRENNGIDVLSLCCRWYGGDMIGPQRFQHISTTILTSLKTTLKLVTLRDLRTNLESLDEEINSLRLNISSSQNEIGNVNIDIKVQEKGKYDDIEDEKKLERLIVAREKTKEALEKRLGKSESG